MDMLGKKDLWFCFGIYIYFGIYLELYRLFSKNQSRPNLSLIYRADLLVCIHMVEI